jgi:hypothetical protein
MKQISGDIDEDHELIETFYIKGNGKIFCYEPNERSFVAINRGTIVYILYENYDIMGRSLVYTNNGDLVCIDPEELELLGLH